MIELTIEQAKKHPSNFLYVWATDEFLNAIPKKYASIIRTKRANQKKVLMLSAEKYLGGFDQVQQYYDAVSKGFEEIYGMSPYEALIVLAQGGSVAGKNWEEGVYGVGAASLIYPSTFAGVTLADGSTVSVDATTGHIFAGNKDITDESKTVYSAPKGTVIAYQLFGYDDFGYCYMSQYNTTRKKYYAHTWTDETGEAHKATNGNVTSASSGASFWGNIQLDWDFFKNIINWILSLFGVPTIPELGSSQTETLSADNTLPNQTTDGFITESGMGEAAAIALLAVAAGTLLAGGFKKGGKKTVS